MEVLFINNDNTIIKGRLDTKLYEALKKILNTLGITQQEFIEKNTREFVLENINLLLDEEKKNK